MPDLFITAIYVSHHSKAFSGRFLPRHRREIPGDVVIMNSDVTAWAAEVPDSVRLVECGDKVGFSVANNRGIDLALAASPDFLMVINSDIVPPDGWCYQLRDVITRTDHTDVGIFTVLLLAYDFDA